MAGRCTATQHRWTASYPVYACFPCKLISVKIFLDAWSAIITHHVNIRFFLCLVNLFVLVALSTLFEPDFLFSTCIYNWRVKSIKLFLLCNCCQRHSSLLSMLSFLVQLMPVCDRKVSMFCVFRWKFLRSVYYSSLSLFTVLSTPFPQIDIIGAVVIVWRVRGKIIRSLLCNIVCNNCAQCNAHTYEQT